MKKTTLLLLATLAPCKVMAQGIDDPYRQDQRQAEAERFAYLSDHALNQVKWLHFAAACRVVPDPTYILHLEEEYIQVPERYGLEHGIPEAEHMQQRMQEAGQQGEAKAENPKTCNFWHAHPEFVRKIRSALGIMD